MHAHAFSPHNAVYRWDPDLGLRCLRPWCAGPRSVSLVHDWRFYYGSSLGVCLARHGILRRARPQLAGPSTKIRHPPRSPEGVALRGGGVCARGGGVGGQILRSRIFQGMTQTRITAPPPALSSAQRPPPARARPAPARARAARQSDRKHRAPPFLPAPACGSCWRVPPALTMGAFEAVPRSKGSSSTDRTRGDDDSQNGADHEGPPEKRRCNTRRAAGASKSDAAGAEGASMTAEELRRLRRCA